MTVTSVCATHTWEQLQGTGSFAGGVGGGVKQILMLLGRWPGSLRQGLCDCAPLAKAGMLDDAPSTYLGVVESQLGGTNLIWSTKD